MPLLILVAIVLFLIFGSPGEKVANMFWASDAAPWEKVDAFYYPDRGDLTVWQSALGLGSAEECRDKVAAMATGNGDPSMTRGDYECGVGKVDEMGGVYRLTVR